MRLFFRVISYISEELLPALHQEEIHNYDGIKETDVTPLNDTKLFGLVRIRQLRVKNGTYSLSILLQADLHPKPFTVG
jgi:hypothetical protein